MRISDWSSDVCSSDLGDRADRCERRRRRRGPRPRITSPAARRPAPPALHAARVSRAAAPPARRRDRQSVVKGKSVSVRANLGGRRLITTKNQKYNDKTTTYSKKKKTQNPHKTI